MYSDKIENKFKDKKISVGDKIKVGKEEGILMPRTHGDPNTIVLKLESGYNIGVKVEKGTRIKKLKSKKKKKTKKGKIKHDPDKPTVLIIHTGGTIASKIDYRTGGVHPAYNPEDIIESVPEIQEIANIKTEKAFNILSEDMKPEYWTKLAKTIKKNKDRVDGIVITHGTDTMHYTSAALSFAVQNPNIPIVLTGAQRSSDRPSTDGALNLTSSVLYAAEGKPGVFVCFHETVDDTSAIIIPGCKARKMHSTRRDAFKSVNKNPHARIKNGKIEYIDELKNGDEESFETSFEGKVALVKTYPGYNGVSLKKYRDEGYKGIVIEGTGMGHVPESVLKEIEKCIDDGIIVAMATQCIYGRVNMKVYDRGRDTGRLGVMSSGDMHPETALVKLMWVLANENNTGKIRDLFYQNLSGELNEKLNLQDIDY